MTLHVFPDPRSLPERLEDGRLRCQQCGRTWWPEFNGRMEPRLSSLRCGCEGKAA